MLVNNAGIYPGSSTVATDEATFDQVYAVNVKAPCQINKGGPGVGMAG